MTEGAGAPTPPAVRAPARPVGAVPPTVGPPADTPPADAPPRGVPPRAVTPGLGPSRAEPPAETLVWPPRAGTEAAPQPAFSAARISWWDSRVPPQALSARAASSAVAHRPPALIAGAARPVPGAAASRAGTPGTRPPGRGRARPAPAHPPSGTRCRGP